MWKFLDAVRGRLRRQRFMKPIYDLGLFRQTVLAALVVLVAVVLGAPLGIVAVFFLGLATRLPIRTERQVFALTRTGRAQRGARRSHRERGAAITRSAATRRARAARPSAS